MKAALHNLGCKVNSYETQAMTELLKEAGYEIIDFNKKADVYVVNTCSVTAMADKKSRQLLHRVRRQNPDACIVATGCFVQTADISEVLECGVDIAIGNSEKSKLVPLLEEYYKDRQTFTEITDVNASDITYEAMKISSDDNHTRAFLKVQDGCNMYCSYCIIPYARGRIRSRSIADVVNEVTGLSKAGFKEVVLTGIHLSSYGHGTDETLADLILAVNEIDGIERIRLGSLEPRVITEDFLSKIKDAKKLCPHFHLSLQSGSQTVLERMNRHYTPEEYEQGCKLLRKHYDDPAITTDVIVGFPGETEEEFDETMEFVKRIGFFELHVFMYSKRQGTKAAAMKNQVPEQIKKARSHELIMLSEEMSADFRSRRLGKNVFVLFEEEADIKGEKYLTGHTSEYIRVGVKADSSKVNQNLEVAVKELTDNEILLGSIVN